MNAALLREAFDFTELDLAENKQGRLSERQRTRVARRFRRQRIFMAVVGVVLGAVAVLLLLPFVQTLSIAGREGPLLGGIVLALLAMLFLSGLFERPPSKVDSVEGKAQFVRRTTDTTDAEGVVQSSTNHYVVIGGHEFTVRTSQYEAFTQGHVYKVYYGPGPIGTLSLEYIGPPEEP